MAVETYVRFRPVQPLDKGAGNPVQQARARWTKELSSNPDVLRFEFSAGKIGAPLEREESLAGSRPAVDITIVWASLDAATRTFGNNSLFEFLCGYVVGAPVVVVDGEPQFVRGQAVPAGGG